MDLHDFSIKIGNKNYTLQDTEKEEISSKNKFGTFRKYFLYFLLLTSLILSATVIHYRIMLNHKNAIIENLDEMISFYIGEKESEIKYKDYILNNLDGVVVRYVTITYYNSLESQTDSTPNITASGRKCGIGQVAVSRDLFNDGFKFGEKVYIKDAGEYIVTDLMHARFKHSVDIWLPLGMKIKNRKTLVVLIKENKD